MNNKKTLLIILLALILLLSGAYVLYDKLSEENDTPRLSIHNSETKAENDKTDTQAPEYENTEENSAASHEQSKTLAPDFTVYNLDGTPVKLSDFRGKPVVLNFWSSRCGPCKTEMPDFNDAHKIYEDNIHFLMVNVTDGSWDTIETASTFIAESGYTFPVYYDTDIDAAAVYGITSLPSTFIIDPEGYLIAYGIGAMNMEALQSGIDMVYKS